MSATRGVAVKVKEYTVVAGFDTRFDVAAGASKQGDYFIRVYFNKSLIDCFQATTEVDAYQNFKRAGYRMIEEASEQKESEDDRGGQATAAEPALGSREKGAPRFSGI